MEYRQTGQDPVTRLIDRCHQDRQVAEDLFTNLIGKRLNRARVGEEEIILSEEELGEFAARFSAEVEPTLWESKRRKDQL
jgi:hypothetical protein